MVPRAVHFSNLVHHPEARASTPAPTWGCQNEAPPLTPVSFGFPLLCIQ
jgi:hypothetical protein